MQILNLSGWNASVTGSLYKSLGITADFGGHYGSTGVYGPVHRYSYLFGPAYAFRLRIATIFGHALFGTISQGPHSLVVADLNYSRFMWAVGGGVDVNVSHHFAVRPAQLDYERHNVPAFASNNPTNGFRYSGGVVAKF